MFKKFFHKALVAFAVISATAMACNGSLQQSCITGQTAACTGTNGCSGVQTCLVNGTFGTCACDDAAVADTGVDAPIPKDAAPEADAFITPDTGFDSSSPCTGTPPAQSLTNAHVSQPTTTTTTLSKGYMLRLELNGFTGYGVADDAADILYTSNIGAWTFSIPSTPIVSATLAVSLVATDGTGTPASNFTYQVWADGCSVDTPKALPHGSPFNSQFNNWVEVDETAYPQPNGTLTVTIANTANAAQFDWIGIDWIELRVVTN